MDGDPVTPADVDPGPAAPDHPSAHGDPGIDRVGVLGCGQMGVGIAEVAGRAGLDVVLVGSSEQSLAAGRARLADSLRRSVERAVYDAATAAAIHRRVLLTTDVGQLADRQLVVETTVEDEQRKRQAFTLLDEVVKDPTAIFATNTSSIPVGNLAAAVSRPEQVVGTHFFYPVPVMPLVELTAGLQTTTTTVRRTRHLLTQQLGKQVIDAPDRVGFVVNALLVPYLMASVRMAESGFARPAEIDDAMVGGCRHPMGPLRLVDLIGLDVLESVADALYAEFREPTYAPPPLLRRMVRAGRLGRKSGRGFYDYPA
ncbi:3-hydroxybutyryl-CoA dehydrogenase [Solwaraspora sp. WMMD791]|uniref:3-hydroxybutyryl-CoA dehydrogenase n=1 Tax=Solwaraspora sp. WMMD791 TaxID=3016086 RepID=UPI00249CE893|nr:3-hydroxybutyryl-CoA dehydrogenase [Solwaraspora sp. WMMD791]WFE29017.1 3-hydroxybutyryl-CoA dehydrogenase [Solwaraspora sp. WMMD791]